MEAPVQYFQSVIAIELAVTGALLFQIRFFDKPDEAGHVGERRPDPRLLLLLALVLGATMFGSLWAMLNHAGTTAASFVTVGLAVSLLPIFLHVLPPIARDAATHERDPDHGVTVVGLVLYLVLVAGAVVVLNTERGATTPACFPHPLGSAADAGRMRAADHGRSGQCSENPIEEADDDHRRPA